MKIFKLSFEKSVGAVIFRQEDGKRKYLLLHYPSGHWDFVKGHVEKDETEEETMRREILEEAGIAKVEMIRGFKDRSKFFYRAKQLEKEKRLKNGDAINVFKRVVYYLAEVEQGEIRISFEHIDFGWFDYEQAYKKITYKNSRDILERADKFLS